MDESNKRKEIVSLAAVIISIYLITFTSAVPPTRQNGNITNETQAIAFLEKYNTEYALLLTEYVHADWNYNTNITDENAEAAIEADLAVSEFSAVAFDSASQFNPENFTNDTKRQLFYVGSKSLSDGEMKNLSSIIAEMGSIYAQGKVCRNTTQGEEECLSLEPELVELMASSRNASELLFAWAGWRRVVGQQIKPLYFQYVELKNKLAVVNGFSDYGDELRQKYEDPEFESDILGLYEEMKPLYEALHAYIRRKLYETYGPDVVNINGTLPQHLLGDMWGRFWTNLYSIGVPYPDRPSLDITEALVSQNYTITKMFETGDDFYTSMGLIPVPSTFYNYSMLEKPDDREVFCHATAWDFYDGKDFRIRICTKVNMEDFLTVHHELGHVQYFMQYAGQPTVYREGANDGFHEAVGELMSMCVSTPKHLYTIGLLDSLPNDNETEINYLFKQSLSTVSTLPFHYLQDLWRWKAFRGDYNDTAQWNDEFWKLSEEIVGVNAPAPRTPDDLDGPSIFHVSSDFDMIRYFCRTVLQFQFAESLCDAAGHEGALSDCDFYGSKLAGDRLSAMLQLGRSKPWPDALEALTGARKMNATAIRKYFEPLEKWLEETNRANGDVPGWTSSSPSGPKIYDH